ncbi:MAG: 3'(2'),5'-bisphosphate nucleotidase CysQ [Candidatus Aenigmarchaeota archaeon]|nr:3'(2'),5'-bisphosphate nucleotidase CysQ [Candidatus Aenigmarchaeota archaeon]
MNDLSTLTRIAKEAGALLLSLASNGKRADREADLFWKAALAVAFPGQPVVSEETFAVSQLAQFAGRVWLIDPLDGTASYTRGEESYTTMATLVERGRPILAVVHQPATGSTYAAARGEGAFRNGRRIRVSSRATLAEMRLVHRHTMSNNLPAIIAALPCAEKAVCGSLGLKLSLIASGRFDLTVYDSEPNLWDTLPGILILEEAGGQVTDLFGRPVTADRQKASGLLASNGHIHKQLLRKIQPLSAIHQRGTR